MRNALQKSMLLALAAACLLGQTTMPAEQAEAAARRKALEARRKAQINRLIADAQKLYDVNQFREASDLLRRATLIDPQDASARLMLRMVEDRLNGKLPPGFVPRRAVPVVTSPTATAALDISPALRLEPQARVGQPIPRGTRAQRIAFVMKFIQDRVAPGTWWSVSGGGVGTMRVEGDTLILCHYRKVVREAEELLRDYWPEHYPQIAIGCRMVAMTPEGLQRIVDEAGLPPAIAWNKPGPVAGTMTRWAAIDDKALSLFLNAAQSDKRSITLTMPRIAACPGTAARSAFSQGGFVSRFGDWQPSVEMKMKPTLDAAKKTITVALDGHIPSSVEGDLLPIPLTSELAMPDAGTALIDFRPQEKADGKQIFVLLRCTIIPPSARSTDKNLPQ